MFCCAIIFFWSYFITLMFVNVILMIFGEFSITESNFLSSNDHETLNKIKHKAWDFIQKILTVSRNYLKCGTDAFLIIWMPTLSHDIVGSCCLETRKSLWLPSWWMVLGRCDVYSWKLLSGFGLFILSLSEVIMIWPNTNILTIFVFLHI